MKVELVMRNIEQYLSGTYTEIEDWPFYLELEGDLSNYYEEMMKENEELTSFLNDDIPDICAEVGNIDIDEFKRLLTIEYVKAKEILEKTK